MKRIIIYAFISIVAIGFISSCSKTKTYAQYLNKERDAIERFIKQNDIIVLHEYPKDSVFKENEFYFDKFSGVYYNVVDSGNGRRIKNGEEFYVRFDGMRYIDSSDTTVYSNIKSDYGESLKYGLSSSYPTAAWVVPLRNVGNRALVKMIVPFNMGFQADKPAYKTAYYEKIDYRFDLWEQ